MLRLFIGIVLVLIAGQATAGRDLASIERIIDVLVQSPRHH